MTAQEKAGEAEGRQTVKSEDPRDNQIAYEKTKKSWEPHNLCMGEERNHRAKNFKAIKLKLPKFGEEMLAHSRSPESL